MASQNGRYSEGPVYNKRPCPMQARCKGVRKTGEIFCHVCYFKLPKQYRDMLWGRNIRALKPAIEACTKWLTAEYQEGGANS